MDGVTKLELELAKLKACREDLYVALNKFNSLGYSKEAVECGQKINKVSITIARIEAHIRDYHNFMWLINNLDSRGILSEGVRNLVH